VIGLLSEDGTMYDEQPPALNVVVTFNALYEFASVVGGERVSVSQIIPDGADAHHFEPVARDLAALQYADIFIMNGLGFEPWAQHAIDAAGHDGLVIIDVSAHIDPIAVSNDCHGCSGDNRGAYDPHIWLSLGYAGTIAREITVAFIDADIDGWGYYEKNLSQFLYDLYALYQEYHDRFSALEYRTIVTSHAVFAYLCREFGLYQRSIKGIFSEGEPSARALADLVEFCRENNITVVLTEYLKSPLIAETLANEIDGTVKTIYTIESAEAGLSFIERMAINLAVIYESLSAAASKLYHH